jgi:hypothetical protein
MEAATQGAQDRCDGFHSATQQRGYSRRMQGTGEPIPISAASSEETWTLLIKAVRAEIAEAIETTLQRTHTMHSYDAVTIDVRRELVTRSYQAVLHGMEGRRRPDASTDGTVFELAGEARGRQGVAIREMLALWRIGLETLHALARRVAPTEPGRDALLLEFLECAMTWADFAMMHAAEGHRRGELSQARELQHAQSNCVRRVLSGTASAGEIGTAIEPLALDPHGSYHAVRVRPMPDFDMEAIERYLSADGVVKRGNGLLALIDGDACGFVAQLPRSAPRHAVGISDPVKLAEMQPAFKQATRALETALTLGFRGIFGIGDLGIHPALVVDTEVGDVMMDRYVRPILAHSGGDAILTTVERYLINDRSVDITARELTVHSNTVRQRLAKFEDVTQRSMRDTEVVVELWWALQRRHIRNTPPTRRG